MIIDRRRAVPKSGLVVALSIVRSSIPLQHAYLVFLTMGLFIATVE